MSYKFEAEPKVVHSRAKYRPEDQPSDGVYGSPRVNNLLQDNRVKSLTPSQQEEEYVRIEKDRIKIENMTKQLVAFKANKKISPYDIKPAANPRVKPNLEFFLTDSADVKPAQTHIDVQTDVFKEKPQTPPYIPKKTGRDVSTQIEDNELFNFDREVTPIIDVIVTKTLDQAIIEIEEEEELSRIKHFKEEYYKRRQQDEQKWTAMLEKELEAIANKNKKVEEYRLREEKRIAVLRKVQAYQIAHTYLRDLGKNAMTFLHENGLYQNTEKEEMVNNVPNFFIEGVMKTLGQRFNIRDMVAQAFTQLEGEIVARREIADKRFKHKQEKKKARRVNFSKDERLVRFIYEDETTPSSHFVRFVSKLQEQELAAYFVDYKNRVNQLKEKLQNSELNQEDYAAAYASDFPELQIPSNLRIALNDLQVLSFNVANNKYYSELHKDGFLDISVSAFDKEGGFLYQIDKTNPRNTSKSIKYLGNIRDNQIKISDDLGMKINLNKIEPEVNHLVLTVEVRNLEQSIAIFNDLQYSRFRLADYTTNQTIEDTDISSNFKFEELKDPAAESELGGKILCYYLNKTSEFGWVVEAVKSFKNVPIESYANFNKVVENYLQVCMDEQAKESGEPANLESSFDQQSMEKTKSKAKLSPPPSNVPSKVLEKKDEVYGAGFVTRTFGPISLKTSETIEDMKGKVDQVLEKEAPLLHQSFEYGYEIQISGSEWIRPTQIKKIGDVTTFVIKRKPKPYEEPVVLEGTEGTDQEGKEEEDDE